MGMKAV